MTGRKATEIIFAEQKGVENLAAAANTVVQQAAVHLLAKAVIADVQVRGNERIESEAVKLNVKSKKGEVLRPDLVAEDIKAVYKMGFFEKVEAEVADSPAGKVLVFAVQENPTIQEVTLTGNKKIKEKDIMAAIATRPFSVVQRTSWRRMFRKSSSFTIRRAFSMSQSDPPLIFRRSPQGRGHLYCRGKG